MEPDSKNFTPVDGNQGDYFGFKVSVSNDYLVVSSEKADNQCANSGIVYLYQRDGKSWNFQYKLTSQDPDIDDYFGRSVSIHNNDIAIGAFNNDDNGDNSGSAYFYNLGTIPALFEISDQTIGLTSVSQIIQITIFHTDGRDININVHSSDQQVIPDSNIDPYIERKWFLGHLQYLPDTIYCRLSGPAIGPDSLQIRYC